MESEHFSQHYYDYDRIFEPKSLERINESPVEGLLAKVVKA